MKRTGWRSICAKKTYSEKKRIGKCSCKDNEQQKEKSKEAHSYKDDGQRKEETKEGKSRNDKDTFKDGVYKTFKNSMN